MRILCATDFSEPAEAAVRIAVDLAQRTSGSVELVHVLPPPTATRDLQALAADAAVFDEAVRTAARDRLSAATRQLAAGRDIRIDARLIEGEIETSLLARARELSADLVVLGANGRPTLERLVLGSVAERMVRLAACPVLIAPPGASELPGAGELPGAKERAADQGRGRARRPPGRRRGGGLRAASSGRASPATSPSSVSTGRSRSFSASA